MNPTFPFDKITVELTAQNCADGVRNNEHLCVVSTALMRLIPDANWLETNINTIRFSFKHDGKNYRVVFITPPEVQDYVRQFDAGAKAEPMTFTLENPNIAERVPKPKGAAKTPSFKPQGAPKTRRAIRVFGEKSWEIVEEEKEEKEEE